MINMHWLKEKYVRWIGIALVPIIVVLVERKLINEIGDFWTHYLIAMGFTALYWNGCYFIFMFFRKQYPDLEETARRLTYTFLVMFVWMSVGGIPLKMLFGLVEYSWIGIFRACAEYYHLNFILALIIGTIYETVFFFEKWKDAIRQNEELKNQQVRTQFEVLQNQMSPHFLFNSLNTLTTLIAENQEVAIEFTQKLSDVYRYILQTKDKELIPLEEEIHFVKDYIFLLKMRFPDNLIAEIKIDNQYQHCCHIAPLTLQMLIENAIKHNVVSKTHPLHIQVYVENGQSVVVKNNLQKKDTLEKGTKTGLSNIKRRYELLGNRKIDIITTTLNFMVAVPLIRVEREERMFA